MTCIAFINPNLPIRAIDNMGTTLKTSDTPESKQVVHRELSCLTPRELEICILHFVEGRSQRLIAHWLGVAGRTVRLHVQNAVEKVPQLEPLRVKSLMKPVRPKMFHLSQMRPTERGAFNADEV